MLEQEEHAPILHNTETLIETAIEHTNGAVMPRRTRHSWKHTFPIVTMMTCISIFKSLFYCLILDPLVWVYSSIHDVLCCCFASSLSTSSSSSSTTIASSSSTITATTGSSASFYYLQGDWVVHERQSLQLCAVHTINNLLQLTRDDRDLPWICGNRIIKWTATNAHHDTTSSTSSSSQLSLLPEPASQVELDRIACDLMRAEDALLDHSSRYHLGNYCYCRWLPSFRCCHSWNNTHRTLYYGNYSFETLEVALQRRHVSLEWFHIPSNAEELLKVPAGIVVGFIINHVMNDNDENTMNDNHHHQNNNNNNNSTSTGTSTSNRKSFPRSVWKKCCDDPGRHWYAITRVRRRSDNSIWNATTKTNNSNHKNNSSVIDDVINEEAPEEDRWKILDSDRTGETTILRTDEVREYLQHVSDQDATIFRATLTLP